MGPAGEETLTRGTNNLVGFYDLSSLLLGVQDHLIPDHIMCVSFLASFNTPPLAVYHTNHMDEEHTTRVTC
jgi:hypothetical protein